jgi:hypothetical protein
VTVIKQIVYHIVFVCFFLFQEEMSTLHGSVGSHTSVGLPTSSDSGDLPSAISTSDKKQEHITNSNIEDIFAIIVMFLWLPDSEILTSRLPLLS